MGSPKSPQNISRSICAKSDKGKACANSARLNSRFSESWANSVRGQRGHFNVHLLLSSTCTARVLNQVNISQNRCQGRSIHLLTKLLAVHQLRVVLPQLVYLWQIFVPS